MRSLNFFFTTDNLRIGAQYLYIPEFIGMPSPKLT